jgi:hypothetical protein
LTVNAAALTVTAVNESKIYGTTFTPNGATQFTTSGLVNGDSVSSVTLTSSGYASTATVVSPGPTYAITPSAAVGSGLGNYTITYANGTFTVNTAALTITANNASKSWGLPITFSATAFTETGLVTSNGDTITGVTETSSGSAAAAPVSTYSIVPSAATGTGVGNYTITYVNGTLSVNQSVILLDPSASGALTISQNASISLSGGGVYIDSSSSKALTASGYASITATVVDVHGGDSIGGNVTINPAPTLGAPVVSDPLASLAQPSTKGMHNYGSFSLSSGSKTIQPGIYSSITVSATGALTMSSGVYVIEGGNLSVSGQATVNGTGVMIFNAGSKYPSTGGTYGSLQVGGNPGSMVTLTPASSGTYAGIVYFESRDNTTAASVGGNGVFSSQGGVVYMPAAQMQLSGNGMLAAGLSRRRRARQGIRQDPPHFSCTSRVARPTLANRLAKRKARPGGGS